MFIAAIGMFCLFPTAAHAIPEHYTDGSQCEGGEFCSLPSNPPPVAPRFTVPCQDVAEDPTSFVFVTLHVVYGKVAPPAGVVPVQDDTSRTDPYLASPPNPVIVHVANLVAGHQGFVANTWNIGKGVTAWVPFDCTTPESTTTTTEQTTTTTVVSSPPVVAVPTPPVVTQPQLTG